MIEKNSKEMQSYHRADIKKQAGGDEATADSVLLYLLGDGYENKGCRYFVAKYGSTSKTALNRINLIWVLPLFALSVPFQWLFTGSAGLNRNSKMGKIVHKLVNLDS